MASRGLSTVSNFEGSEFPDNQAAGPAGYEARGASGVSAELQAHSLEMQLILSGGASRFTAGYDPQSVMGEVIVRMQALRDKSHPAVWAELAKAAQRHPIREHFHADPFTRHSFEKPRGYAGDAELLDYIYLHPSIDPKIAAASELGRKLFGYSKTGAPCLAVKERRDILAREVDATAARTGGGAEILAIAAGHLREAALSDALREGAVKRWVALDQDTLSVGAVAHAYANCPAIEVIEGSVKGIMRGRYKLGEFDLVYAAGIYDYLEYPIARLLTKRAVRMLKPGGSYLFANFSNEVDHASYMETFMDWTLLQRSEADMWEIAKASVDRNEVDIEVFHGENRNIIYARLTRRQ